MNKIIKKKQKGPETSEWSRISLQNKFRKIHVTYILYLTKFDDAI